MEGVSGVSRDTRICTCVYIRRWKHLRLPIFWNFLFPQSSFARWQSSLASSICKNGEFAQVLGSWAQFFKHLVSPEAYIPIEHPKKKYHTTPPFLFQAALFFFFPFSPAPTVVSEARLRAELVRFSEISSNAVIPAGVVTPRTESQFFLRKVS